jgi:hypothetical protein
MSTISDSTLSQKYVLPHIICIPLRMIVYLAPIRTVQLYGLDLRITNY